MHLRLLMDKEKVKDSSKQKMPVNTIKRNSHNSKQNFTQTNTKLLSLNTKFDKGDIKKSSFNKKETIINEKESLELESKLNIKMNNNLKSNIKVKNKQKYPLNKDICKNTTVRANEKQSNKEKDIKEKKLKIIINLKKEKCPQDNMSKTNVDLINETENSNNDGLPDLSFLDDFDVDEIISCLSNENKSHDTIKKDKSIGIAPAKDNKIITHKPNKMISYKHNKIGTHTFESTRYIKTKKASSNIDQKYTKLDSSNANNKNKSNSDIKKQSQKQNYHELNRTSKSELNDKHSHTASNKFKLREMKKQSGQIKNTSKVKNSLVNGKNKKCTLKSKNNINDKKISSVNLDYYNTKPPKAIAITQICTTENLNQVEQNKIINNVNKVTLHEVYKKIIPADSLENDKKNLDQTIVLEKNMPISNQDDKIKYNKTILNKENYGTIDKNSKEHDSHAKRVDNTEKNPKIEAFKRKTMLNEKVRKKIKLIDFPSDNYCTVHNNIPLKTNTVRSTKVEIDNDKGMSNKSTNVTKEALPKKLTVTCHKTVRSTINKVIKKTKSNVEVVRNHIGIKNMLHTEQTKRFIKKEKKLAIANKTTYFKAAKIVKNKCIKNELPNINTNEKNKESCNSSDIIKVSQSNKIKNDNCTIIKEPISEKVTNTDSRALEYLKPKDNEDDNKNNIQISNIILKKEEDIKPKLLLKNGSEHVTTLTNLDKHKIEVIKKNEEKQIKLLDNIKIDKTCNLSKNNNNEISEKSKVVHVNDNSSTNEKESINCLNLNNAIPPKKHSTCCPLIKDTEKITDNNTSLGIKQANNVVISKNSQSLKQNCQMNYLEKKLTSYFKTNYKVWHLIHSGRFSNIFKCTNEKREEFAVKVLK